MQRDEMPHKNPPQKSKSLLIFGTITALFLGIMGYEVIRENTSKQQSHSSDKKFLIASTIPRDLYQKPDRVELNLLNAQNQHFLNKIISLKEESYENSKRLHLLQASLLAAKTAKENEEIHQLKSTLRQEEDLKSQLEKNLTNLNQDIDIKEIQIVELESLIDLLNDLVESQKKHKQQSHAQFKAKLDTAKVESTDEKERLCCLIHDLETNQTLLKIQMQDHDIELQKLENALNHAQTIALDKEFELDCLQDDFNEKQVVLNDQATNLFFALEAGEFTYKHLQNELYYLETELAVQIEKLKDFELELQNAHATSDELNQQIANQRHELNQKDEELLAAKLLHEQLEKEKRDELLNLTNSLNNEESKSANQAISFLSENYLHEELAITLLNDLQAQQLELEKLKAIHNALSHDRNALNNLIEQKNQIISNLEQSALSASEQYESTTLFLQEKIDSLYVNLDSEFVKTEELSKELKKIQADLIEKDNLSDLEKAYSQDLKKQLNELFDQLTRQEHELTEIKEIALLKQQSNEELTELLSYNEAKREIELAEAKETSISNQQSNAYLNDLLKAHEKELAELKEAYAFNERFNVHLNDLLNVREKELIEANETHLALTKSNYQLNELLTSQERELADVKEAHFGLEKSTQELHELLASRERELSDAKEVHFGFERSAQQLNEMLALQEKELADAKQVHFYHEQSNAELESNLISLKSQLTDLQLKFDENISLNDKIRTELELYKEALDKSLLLEDIEKRTAEELELKLENVNELLKTREEELSRSKETVNSHHITNEELTKEIQRQEEAFKIALKDYEEAQKNTLENERNLNQLTELLLYREKELAELKEMMSETTKSNKMLADKVHQQHEDLNNSIANYAQAEAKANETEKSILHISEMLKVREQQLLDNESLNMQTNFENEKLAKELHQHNLELKEALDRHQVAQHNTHENEKQLYTLIELLNEREEELLKALNTKVNENQQLESKEIETKEYLNKLEQSRHNLQNELDKIRASYANLLNRISDKDERSQHQVLKSHAVVSGDTLRGIALRYYGSPNRWKEIYQANQQIIADQNKIPVGTVLTIP